jgi:sporadic carbohydrate cluster protein (TIGR04323 family)
MLNQTLAELPSLQGIVLYSLFMLPRDTDKRRAVYRRVLDHGASLHGAVESQSILNAADAARIEDIWLVRLALPQCPTQL